MVDSLSVDAFNSTSFTANHSAHHVGASQGASFWKAAPSADASQFHWIQLMFPGLTRLYTVSTRNPKEGGNVHNFYLLYRLNDTFTEYRDVQDKVIVKHILVLLFIM